MLQFKSKAIEGRRLSPLLSSFGMVSSDFVAKSRISLGGTSELSSCADVNGFASRRIVSDSFKELLSLSDESCLWNGLPSVEHSKQLGLPSFDEDVAEVALGKVLLQLHQNKVRFGNLGCSCYVQKCVRFFCGSRPVTVIFRHWRRRLNRQYGMLLPTREKLIAPGLP